MPFSNSFPASHTTEKITPVLPNNFSHSLSQGGYFSARMTNHSRPALSPWAVIPSGYSQVVNAERRSGISFSALSNLSFTTWEQEVVYSRFAMRKNNNMIPVQPPASRANEPNLQISRAFMPSGYSQIQTDSMAAVSRAALYNFSEHFTSHAPEMVASPFRASGHNNIGLQDPRASTDNVPIAAQRQYRANNLITAQQAFRANNMIPSQLPRASCALIQSGRSQVSNAERIGQTNGALVYNFSSSFSRQSSEMVTSSFVSNNIIPSQAPVSWVDLVRAPPSSTSLRLRNFTTGTASNNVDLSVRSLSNPLSSSVLPVHGCSGLSQNTIDSLPHTYDCGECSASFLSPQALGGHRSWHSKLKRMREKTVIIGESSGKKKCKTKHS